MKYILEVQSMGFNGEWEWKVDKIYKSKSEAVAQAEKYTKMKYKGVRVLKTAS